MGVIDNHLSPRSSPSISKSSSSGSTSHDKNELSKYAIVEFENRRSTDTMRFVKPHGKLVLDRWAAHNPVWRDHLKISRKVRRKNSWQHWGLFAKASKVNCAVSQRRNILSSDHRKLISVRFATSASSGFYCFTRRFALKGPEEIDVEWGDSHMSGFRVSHILPGSGSRTWLGTVQYIYRISRNRRVEHKTSETSKWQENSVWKWQCTTYFATWIFSYPNQFSIWFCQQCTPYLALKGIINCVWHIKSVHQETVLMLNFLSSLDSGWWLF